MNVKEIKKLPEIKNVRWLWAGAWYDGILSGPVKVGDERYYGWCCDEDESDRIYSVHDLPMDAWNHVDVAHALFVEKVGDHWGFDEDGKLVDGKVKPESLWHEYYDKYPPKQAGTFEGKAFNSYPAVGWFKG